MRETNYHKSKVRFQMDRISFFSDAVFAIAITLLVLDLKVPVIANPTDQAFLAAFGGMAFKFIGFLVSFCIVGYYWLVHHRIFGYVERYTDALLKYNFLFLFSVVLLPFSSELSAEYASEAGVLFPYAVYVFNICLTALMNVLLWGYVSDPEKGLLTHQISGSRIRFGLKLALVVPSVFMFSFLVSIFFPIVGRLIPISLPLIFFFIFRSHGKHQAALNNIVAVPAVVHARIVG